MVALKLRRPLAGPRKLSPSTSGLPDYLNYKEPSRQEQGYNCEQPVGLKQEPADFRDELLRVDRLWNPNLNDGVQITAAPLWRLFRLPKWQKTLKETWQKLEKDDYDWAHQAYSIWPDRIREKRNTDKSLAIVHGLENLYIEPPPGQGKKRGGPKPVDEEEIFDEDQ